MKTIYTLISTRGRLPFIHYLELLILWPVSGQGLHVYMLMQACCGLQRMSIAETALLQLLPAFLLALESQPNTRCKVTEAWNEVCGSHHPRRMTYNHVFQHS